MLLLKKEETSSPFDFVYAASQVVCHATGVKLTLVAD